MPTIIYSCEIGAREFLPRILIGAALQKLGFAVIIGHKFTIDKMLARYAGNNVKGLFFYKDASSDSAKYMARAKAAGLVTVGMDEEMLNWDYGQNSRVIVSDESKKYVDYFFASTQVNEDIAKSTGFNTYRAGNLRLALCEELLKANLPKRNDLKKNRLIVSPGGVLFTINPLVAHFEIMTRVLKADWRTAYNHLKSISIENFKTIEKIFDLCESDVDGYDITVRPHPTESQILWNKFANSNGVKIDDVTQSSVLSIFNADEVHAFDCTTLLEAFVLKKPFKNHSMYTETPTGTLVNKYLSNHSLDSYGAPSGAATELENILFLGGILQRHIDFVSNIGVNSDCDRLIIPIKDDLVSQMPPDVALRKGAISTISIETISKLECCKGSSLRIVNNDFIWFPKLES